MNRIVRDHYPVSKLPEDLREGFGPDDEVRVTVEVGAAAEPVPLSRLFAMARPRFTSIEEINAHVRALREEWD